MVIMSKNNKQLKNLAASAAKILNGEYFEKINSDNYSSSLKPIAECIIHLREQMLNQMFEMQVSSNQVDSVSHQIGSVIQTQFENTTKLYEDADEMSQLNEKNKELFQETIHKFDNMDEITVHMKNSINKLEASGHKAQENIKNRLIEIKKIVDCIDKISTSTKTFANYLRELSSSIEEISKVLEIIRNFSKQTHLLSLNASIEAARAGESGRGFSIVAQEVRQMAEDSNNTVDQISGLIKDLNREINNVLKYTSKNEDNVTSAVEESTNVERGLKDIEDAFIAIHGDIKNIIETSNTYTDEISYINKVIENTYLSSQQVAAGIDIVYSSVEKQRNLADKMQNLDNSLKEYSNGLSNVIDKINMNLLDGNNEWMTTQAQNIGNVLESTILENKILENLNYNDHKIILDELIKDNEQIEAIWTNKLDGDFIYSNPPAGIVNSSIREWFQESKAGKTFISDVYISAISKKPCITVSMPAYDEENNLSYLIGADIKIVLSR